jgi:cyclic pyranopterin phosphate synthase
MDLVQRAKIFLPVLTDKFGRGVSYLRVSLTDRCNLRCVYCMPEHGVPYEQQKDILTVDEIIRVITILTRHGLTKVRLTGGEPLVRGRDVIELVERISKIDAITDLGLTTNAVLLSPMASDLKRAGLRRINISLDTLKRDRFAQIARMDKFVDATAGLESAVRVGFDPIKLNMVMMRGVNDDEIFDFAALTIESDYDVRFLEYMPIGQVSPHEWRAKYLGNDETMARLNNKFELTEIPVSGSSTSKIFKIRGARGTIGVISPISHKFCEGCNRLRLTANGALVPCLSDNFEYDIRKPLRSGDTDEQIVDHVFQALSHKPEHSDFEGRIEHGGSLRIMAQIGG